MKKIYLMGVAVGLLASISSCKKSSDETVTLSEPQFQAGQAITHDTLSGSVKGTMLAGKTYYFATPVTVNAGDTLVMQSGVKLLAINPSAQLVVKGTFLSLGTKASPNTITGVTGDQTVKSNSIIDPSSDPAFTAQWGGIQCDVTCPLLVVKWTHLDYSGGNVGTNPIVGYKSGDDLFTILFQNPDGVYILEDSWIYGTTTDGTRVKGGKISIMRNTFEKIAYNDGEAVNVKSGTVGDMAYNMIIGTAKNGLKASNKGGLTQCNVSMYNNTMVNGGYRSIDPARGGSMNYEEGAKGIAYNNIIVNCRYGLRIYGTPTVADTLHLFYGNTLNYGDSASVTNQYYPVGYVTKPMTTDIPLPSSFLPNPYQLGQAYTSPSSIIQANNPKFVNFPLPQNAPHLRDVNSIGTSNFRLQAGSPAIGKGNVAFSPINSVSSITDPFLKATISLPNGDLGAYPTDGTGNQH
ncbi:hypothetical protein [Cytophaga aurantiaca]|uniref:hypothetical protein n=1 Tax=Cytophaga aurantiaca TaxID=29530 RepID=UPI0003752AC2|nr:hypothetical protein [Cytophaga aurantiaca]